MGIFEIILISIGLSLDVFAYCLYKGAMVSELNSVNIAKICSLFTGFQVVALLIGNAFTFFLPLYETYRRANRMWNIVAAIAFFGLGISMMLKAANRSQHRIFEKKSDDFNYRVFLMWALLTSVDALIAGIGFGFLGMRLIGTAVVVGIVTLLNVLIGFFCGYRLGCGPMNKLVAIGGGIVIIGGIDVLVHYFIG